MRRAILQIIALVILGCVCIAAEASDDGSTETSSDGFVYPRPTGGYQVGTSYLFLEDSNRLDVFSDDPDDYRWISIKVWYPAKPPSGAKPAMYGVDEFDGAGVDFPIAYATGRENPNYVS